jgi:hypothetical protein
MMILDLNQVMLASMFVQIGNSKNAEVDEGLIRHMALNSIRAYNQKFKSKYGELVIACDSRHYWRKDVFPYYKANRKKNRDESPLDWEVIFKALHNIRDELKEYFPYRIIEIDGAEADDIIATLCFEHGMNFGQRILIISGDKDFVQLHNHPAVDQFNPILKKWVKHNSPEAYLKEHVIKGDTGDGVPNVLSNDDVLVRGVRQATLTAGRLEALLKENYEADCLKKIISPETLQRNLARNRQLISMTEIPQRIQDEILASFNAQAGKPRKDLFNYFVKFKLKNLMEAIGDF